MMGLLHRRSVELGLLPVGGAGRARVLMYHGVAEPGCDRRNVRNIGTDVFDRHLGIFRKAFHVVGLEALFRGERHPDKLTVALTFDDGLRNNLSHALPVLERHAIPATFFITGANRCGLRALWSDLLDLSEHHTDRHLQVSGRTWKKNARGRYADPQTAALLRDHIKRCGVWAPKQEINDQLTDLLDGPLQADRLLWELLTDEEIKRCAAHPLVDIGSHGWWHNDMGRIPVEEVREELVQSRAYLHALTGKAPRSLAWPSGSHSEESVQLAGELGFEHQLSVDGTNSQRPGEAPFTLLSRYGVYDFPVRDRWLQALVAAGSHE